MRETQLLEQFQSVVPPLPDGRGRILADTIDGQNRGLVERRGVKRAGGVGLVVLSEKDPALFRQPGQLLPDGPAQIQLFAQPRGHHAQESIESARRDGQTRFQQTRELNNRLVIENNCVEISCRQAALPKTIISSISWKAFVVLSS